MPQCALRPTFIFLSSLCVDVLRVGSHYVWSWFAITCICRPLSMLTRGPVIMCLERLIRVQVGRAHYRSPLPRPTISPGPAASVSSKCGGLKWSSQSAATTATWSCVKTRTRDAAGQKGSPSRRHVLPRGARRRCSSMYPSLGHKQLRRDLPTMKRPNCKTNAMTTTTTTMQGNG